ncbi:tRNA-2-methylthio-N(6)-dimethylallyladenosine synthase [Candidatus Anstonella stagnisolia]|nr:tRNA-2-methylthio-N(6)-dimethylallyladenosine synthase [Candidatus Anstonella stagnisolia]
MKEIKYKLITYGCTLNQADSNIMRGVLDMHGCLEVEEEKGADVVVINSCTVKDATQTKIEHVLKKLHLGKKPIVLAGCLSVNENAVFRSAPNASVVGTGSVGQIYEAVQNAVGRRKAVFKGSGYKPDLPRVRNGAIARIAIEEGCLSSCTFCQTKLARGKLYSYPLKSICLEVKRWADAGAVEMQLTGQDAGAYGADIKSNVAALLGEACEVDGNFRIRIGMINPQHVKKYLPQLLKVYEDLKMYKFLHIPVQSGSNKVLREMRRENTKEEFLELVRVFREKFPDMSIMTDIIVGFPTENEEDFGQTMEMLQEAQLDRVNVSRFSPRPFTIARKMKQLSNTIVKRRTVECAALCKKITIAKNKEWIGKEMEITITEKVKTLNGRDENYRQVALPTNFKGKIGEKVRVKIIGAEFSCLLGKPI